MKKRPVLVAAALLGLGLATSAAPAFAATIAQCTDDVTQNPSDPGQNISQIDADAPAILAGLRAKGVNATDISDWGGCVRADVTRPDGRTVFEFFDPSSLQRLSRG